MEAVAAVEIAAAKAAAAHAAADALAPRLEAKEGAKKAVYNATAFVEDEEIRVVEAVFAAKAAAEEFKVAAVLEQEKVFGFQKHFLVVDNALNAVRVLFFTTTNPPTHHSSVLRLECLSTHVSVAAVN